MKKPMGRIYRCRSCGRRLSKRTYDALEDGSGCPFCRTGFGGRE